MNELTSQNITYDKKNRTARSRHSSLAFIPHANAIANPTVLKRIVKNRDKGKRF